MLTHVHKVTHLVVNTFEQGLRRWRSRGNVFHDRMLVTLWPDADVSVRLMLTGCTQEAMVGPNAGRVRSRVTGRVQSLFPREKTLLDSTGPWVGCVRSFLPARPVTALTTHWLTSQLLKINAQYLNEDTWCSSMGLAHSNRTLSLRPVNPINMSGCPAGGTMKGLMALFFGDTYK
jgi:hypothetical protein